MRGYYHQEQTFMALVMFESEDLGALRQVDIPTLHSKLANWHRSVMPARRRNLETYGATGVDVAYYHEWNLPHEWQVWRADRESHADEYPGAGIDAEDLHSTPVRDAILWDSGLAMMGVFPDTFPAFLRGIGHTTGEVRAVSRKLAFVMRAHLRGLYFTYQTLTRERRSLGTHPEPSTSGTPRRARRREATTAERRRKAMRREIRMGKAPARCPEDPAHELRLASEAAQRIYGGTNQEESGPSGVGMVRQRDAETAAGCNLRNVRQRLTPLEGASARNRESAVTVTGGEGLDPPVPTDGMIFPPP